MMRSAAVLESADRADSNSAVREDVWVQVPPAVPLLGASVDCLATPPNVVACARRGSLGAGYAYLLGLYLGDGMLTPAPRNVWRLRISLDARHLPIIARAAGAISEVGLRAAGRIRRKGCIELYSNWKHWKCLFPQHGPGRKHLRPISMREWQRRLIADYPVDLIRGLIDSDGCRCINSVKGREYPRYFFSNRSPEIRALFTGACAALGVDCRPAGERNISVARRPSVAILDALMCRGLNEFVLPSGRRSGADRP
jgi:hypothetical protein